MKNLFSQFYLTRSNNLGQPASIPKLNRLEGEQSAIMAAMNKKTKSVYIFKILDKKITNMVEKDKIQEEHSVMCLHSELLVARDKLKFIAKNIGDCAPIVLWRVLLP